MLLRNDDVNPFLTVPLGGRLSQHWFWMLYMQPVRIYTTYSALFLECFNTYHPSARVDHYFDHHPGASEDLKEETQHDGIRDPLGSFQFAWR